MERPELECFDHLAIEVRELESAMAFYEGVLGLLPLPTPDVALQKGIRWYSLPEGKMLHLVTNAASTSASIGHFALRVSDVAAWRRYLSAAGVSEEPALVKLYGTAERLFVFRNPSGNRIEFVSWG